MNCEELVLVFTHLDGIVVTAAMPLEPIGMKHVGVGIGLCRGAAVGSAPVGGAGAKVSIGDTRRQTVVCRGVVFDLWEDGETI